MSKHRPLVSKPEMLELVNLSYPAVWRKIKDGKFPRAVVIGDRTFWYLDEVEGWLAERPRQAFAGPNGYEREGAR